MSKATTAKNGVRIRLTGIVQGVGFRPFVFGLAKRLGLVGFCLNDSEGVVIEVSGDRLMEFMEALRTEAPVLAQIDSLTVEPLEADAGFTDFTIRESVSVAGRSVFVSPDISTCQDCLRELFDPNDRRHLYPFINCTNCGPRYSIIKDIPYDRPLTTMAPFEMCPECESEYRDPADRRFHAQPNACDACGPSVWLAGGAAEVRRGFHALKETRRLLREGAIVAVKGLGGFHLACDATNIRAVRALRQRKRRSNKPFAVMTPDAASARTFCAVSAVEEEALTDRTRPIVLLEKLPGRTLAEDVSPGNGRYGVMLPYTPVHHLIFGLSDGYRDPGLLVMTSGNLSEEPIVTSNEEALRRLKGVADFFLLHDREIYMRVDDSIVEVRRGKKRVLRRARGFTPLPLELAVEPGEEAVEVLACGAGLKNTLCLTKGGRAIPGQHMGDLENSESLAFFEETLRNLKKTFRAEPKAVAFDLHPDYLSTRFAIEYAAENNIPDEMFLAVQHHHAHVAACMAEHGLKDRVIGVAFDGTGYGTDGNVWGGEFLLADRTGFVRAAHLGYVRLPGGDRAVKEPWRCALSHLHNAYGEGLHDTRAREVIERFDANEAGIIIKMIETGLNSPLTSSAGRLFDAVASIIGLRDRITFEGEAAIELEQTAGLSAPGLADDAPYPFGVTGENPFIVDTAPLIRAVVEDLALGAEIPVIAARFHRTMAEVILKVASALRERTEINDVVLSGGVFQNNLLTDITETLLKTAGFMVYTHERVPANDGGISLGQTAVLLETLRQNANN